MGRGTKVEGGCGVIDEGEAGAFTEASMSVTKRSTLVNDTGNKTTRQPFIRKLEKDNVNIKTKKKLF